MRLGILGPAAGDLPALARAARSLLDDARADKVLYLADDDALDQVVAAWGASLVGDDPGAQSLFDRAARVADAGPSAIDDLVSRERARSRLRVLVSLPPAPSRTIELVDGRVVLFVHDKSMLEEDDIASAAVLVFGRSDRPVLRPVGPRMFLSPGPLSTPRGGRAVLDDAGGGIRVSLLDSAGRVTAEARLDPRKRVRVQGEGPA